MKLDGNHRAFAVKNGVYQRTLAPGFHLPRLGWAYETHDIREALATKLDFVQLKGDAVLMRELTVAEVPEQHLWIHFVDGYFRKILPPGRHGFWKCVQAHTFVDIDLLDPFLPPTLPLAVVQKPEFKEHIAAFAIDPGEVGLLFVDKAFTRELVPGNHFFWKGCKSINVIKVDLRRQQLEIAGQDILTRDKAGIRVNFLCHYRVVDPRKSHVEVKDAEQQLYALAQLALREIVGSRTLDEILDRKGELSDFVSSKLSQARESIGLEVLGVGVKDIILPGEMKEILNQVLIAEKKAQANLITRREETASTRSLLNTAKLMEENSVLFKLKELEFIERISEKISQITLAGDSRILDQLRSLFTAAQRTP